MSRGLVFELNGHRHALALCDLERLLPWPTLMPLPKAAAGLAGLLDLHGTSVPVVDLQALFGWAASRPCLGSRLALPDPAVLASAGCPRCVLILQRTGQVTPVGPPGRGKHPGAPLDAAAPADLVLGLASDEHGPLLWLDLPALLRREVRPRLAALAPTAGEVEHAQHV